MKFHSTSRSLKKLSIIALALLPLGYATTASADTSYTLSVAQSINGIIAPASTTVANGSSQTFTFTPIAGYEVSSITVDGTVYTNTAPNPTLFSYYVNYGVTFSNIASAHTIAASYAPDSPGANFEAWNYASYPRGGSTWHNTIDSTNNATPYYTYSMPAFNSDATGSYFTFNGGSCMSFAHPNSILRDFTLAAWVRVPTSATSGSTDQWYHAPNIIGGDNPGVFSGDFGLAIANGQVVFGNGGTGKINFQDVSIHTENQYNDAQWHYVVATRTFSNDLLQIYVDGQLQATGFGAAISYFENSQPGQFIGCDVHNNGNLFTGDIASVSEFPTVLSLSQIQLQYRQGRAAPNVVAPTTPDAPTNLSVSTPRSGGIITLSWSPVADNGSGPITSYVCSSGAAVTISVTGTSCTFTNQSLIITNNTASLSVVAVNQSGTSDPATLPVQWASPPTTTTTTTTPVRTTKTITCHKGSQSKKVTGATPVCPSGWKQ